MEIITLEEQRQANLVELKSKKTYIKNYCVIKINLTMIINLRKSKALKYEDVASFLDLDKTLYFKREKGKVNFTIIELKKLSILYGVSLDSLIYVDEQTD